MSKLMIYHGSPQIVEHPVLEKGKKYNDYGQGFYCTEHLELAREWACTENMDGIVNQYELTMGGLNILNLSDGRFSVLHWLALLMNYRILKLSTPVMRKGAEWLKENYLTDLSEYDVVIGWRADDSYFSFARAFVNNEITLHQLSKAMSLGNLGKQMVLKSEKAFDALDFLSYERVDGTVYYPKRKARDLSARAAYLAELENEDLDGRYMRDLIRNGVKHDETSL